MKITPNTTTKAKACARQVIGPREELTTTIPLNGYLFIFYYFIYLFHCLFVVFSHDRVSLCSPGCPGTHSVDQADLELRNPPASASQVLGLKACATTPGKGSFLERKVLTYKKPQKKS